MKKLILIGFSFLVLLFVACSEINSPKIENEIIFPTDNCSIIGVEIDFVDSCSYNFVMPFLASFDSITVVDTYLGSDFYIFADSGDYSYWKDYFYNDPTIKYFYRANPYSDSLLLIFTLTGQKTLEEEIERFENIEHLEIINIEEHPKLVEIDVPENKEIEWAEFFKQFGFVSDAHAVGVCVD